MAHLEFAPGLRTCFVGILRNAALCGGIWYSTATEGGVPGAKSKIRPLFHKSRRTCSKGEQESVPQMKAKTVLNAFGHRWIEQATSCFGFLMSDLE